MARFILVHDAHEYPNSTVYVNLDQVQEIRQRSGGGATIYFSSLTPEGERHKIDLDEKVWTLMEVIGAEKC